MFPDPHDWWVRAELRWSAGPDEHLAAELADALAARYTPYRDHPFKRLLVFEVVGLTGWSATIDP